jgi:hypothetical protein
VEDEFIERRIVTGLIVSTPFIREIYPGWDPQFIESSAIRVISNWCMDYFQKYDHAPGRDIQTIYFQRLRNGLPKDQAETIEMILEGLDEEHDGQKFNLEYLLDQTKRYFKEQHLRTFADGIQAELTHGSLTDAEKLATEYSPLLTEDPAVVDPFSEPTRIRRAFEYQGESLIELPKAIGTLMNPQLTRDALVAFLGREKIGKTFMLIEMAMRGIQSGSNVAFFEAGDMSEGQMLKRLCIYLTKRSDAEKYCEGMYVPVSDCIRNQTDVCTGKNRESAFGIFPAERKRDEITMAELEDAYKQNPQYRPCRNCKNQKGSVWLKWRRAVKPLTWKEGFRAAEKFQRRHKRQFRLCTYSNESLSTSEIRTLLNNWERQDGFIPDIIVIDYADLLTADPDCRQLDFRNQQNRIWQRLRRLSQERHCLVITATQASATSYKRDLLRLEDFSEDKRKYAHVTAMYGLNQSNEEKRIGLMRINEMVVREGDFDTGSVVRVLQRLQMGRPLIGSIW